MVAFYTEELGSKYTLRIEKWIGQESWRVGLNWVGKDDYDFICEKPTLVQALKCAYDYTLPELVNKQYEIRN